MNNTESSNQNTGSPTQDTVFLSIKKRRLERTLIVMSVLAIIGLTILQTYVVRLGAGVPTSHSILVFALVNINTLLLFFLLLLVLRNLYKIFFEESKTTGAQLRTKLIVAFVSLSLVPTALLFYAAYQFITTGHEYWFDQNVEQSLVDSLVVAQYHADLNERLPRDFGEYIRAGLIKQKLYRPEAADTLAEFLQTQRTAYHLSYIRVWSTQMKVVALARDTNLPLKDIPPLPQEYFLEAAEKGRPLTLVDTTEDRDLVRVVWPLQIEGEGLVGFMVVGHQTMIPIKKKLQAVESGLQGYRELKRLRDPIRASHIIALTIVALLSLFISTWIAFHLARGITGPIMELAEAANKISDGDYDVSIDEPSGSGEIRKLVDSFNRMALDLKIGKAELTQKNYELIQSNQESDQRRRYMEVVLKNVAAGVISADARGVITTLNDSAEEILHIDALQILGRHHTEIMSPEHLEILNELIEASQKSYRGSAEKRIRLQVGGQWVSLHVHLNRLTDETGRDMGMVIVINDLSGLEKAQRMEAWQEVARRIAHEVKNPLTPIQLSTQRLRRRYGERLADDGQLFDECTTMIIRQVEELRRLVTEFSNFARMPEANPTPNNVVEIVDEVLSLYVEGHKEVAFQFHADPVMPVFNLDREQIKRVLINLLDNALAALTHEGRIEVRLDYDQALKMARLEVADNGIGISPADKGRLFEPYFSTKKSGTGLGLAIVRTIIADHNGFVRVQDNPPRGTRFIIELPVKA